MRTNFAPRSIPLTHWQSLFDLPGTSVYSLQMLTDEADADAEGVDQYPLAIFNDFDKNHGPFMDSAALIKNLDLVITIDTSLAHLAGGLGIPVWVLLPKPADWRWMLERTDCPWYPTMKLFRQTTTGDWNSVLNDVVEQLKKML